MIELITGLPGNGKTLYTISTVKAKAERENRPVFYNGIPDLTLNWERLEDPKEWAKCPPGSIIVIDEAQKTFRNRSMGTVPPEFVQQLETHRHLGIDLVLITQHPSLIDPAVRRLSGSHRHMVRIWGMEASTVHQWPAVKDNCDKSRGDSEKTKWAFDKSVYGYYKSAEVHTMKRSIPGRVKLLAGLLLAFAVCAWYVAHYVMKKAASPPPAVASAPKASPTGEFVPGNTNGTQTKAPARSDNPVADLKDYVWTNTPRVSGLPQTAPKYDQLTVPVRVPVPAACIQRGDIQKGQVSCKCYTQQGTPMQVEFNMCIEFAQHGFFQDFDAEKEKAQAAKVERSVEVLSSKPDAPVRAAAALPPPELPHSDDRPAVAVLAYPSTVTSQRSQPDKPLDDGLVPSRVAYSAAPGKRM